MDDVRTLRKSIAKITGRMPVSTDRTYLERRLADLQKVVEAGGNARVEYAEPTGVISVSMPLSIKKATIAIAKRDGVGVSELVRRALAAYARENGYDREAEAFGV